MFDALLQNPNAQFCGVQEDEAFENVFCFLKPLSFWCHLMVMEYVGTSNGLNFSIFVKCLDRQPIGSSSSVLVNILWVFHLPFLFHNPRDLLRNLKWLSYCIPPQQWWCAVRDFAYVVQQPDYVQKGKDFSSAIRMSAGKQPGSVLSIVFIKLHAKKGFVSLSSLLVACWSATWNHCNIYIFLHFHTNKVLPCGTCTHPSAFICALFLARNKCFSCAWNEAASLTTNKSRAWTRSSSISPCWSSLLVDLQS